MSKFPRLLYLIISLASLPAAAEWVYNAQNDELRGTTNRSAYLLSNDRSGALAIRNRNGKIDAFVRINKGGIVNYDTRTHGVTVTYRFDNGPIETIEAGSSADRTSAFFPNPTQFVTRITNATKLIVEVPVFRRTPAQFSFDLTGFSLEKLDTTATPEPPKPEPQKTE